MLSWIWKLSNIDIFLQGNGNHGIKTYKLFCFIIFTRRYDTFDFKDGIITFDEEARKYKNVRVSVHYEHLSD